MFNHVKSYLLLTLSSFSFLIISCTNPSKNDVNYTGFDTLRVDNQIFSQAFQMPVNTRSLQYVRLETNTYSKITRIDQLEIHQEVIFVLDCLSNKIILFTLAGDFLRSISIKDGQIHQFDFFDGNLFVLEKKKGKIYEYSLDGSLIKTFNTGKQGGQFVVFNQGAFAFNTLGLKTATKDSEAYQLAIYNNQLIQLKLPFKKPHTGLKYTFGNQFSRYHKQIEFLTAFTNTIYQLDPSTIKAVTKFDFGLYNMPDSVFLSRNRYNDYNQTPYVTDLLTVFHIDSYSFHKFAYKGEEGYLLTDGNRKKIIQGGIGVMAGAESDYFNPIPIFNYQDKLVAIIEPAELLSNIHIRNSRLFKQHDIQTIKYSDNPFLLFYTLL